MKRLFIFPVLLAATVGASAQQALSVSNGTTTYYFPSSESEMPFGADATVTINGCTFSLAEYPRLEVVGTCPVGENSVYIHFDATQATIGIHGSVASGVSATVSGAHVEITQSDAVATEITYIVDGSSADGSLTLNGSFKSTIELNGLNLTNPRGAAVNIQNGKRIALSAKSGTINTLTDGPGEQKGALCCKGHLELKGKGSLTVTGNQAHAIFAKEYLTIKNLSLAVNGAVKDGINCNQYFAMESGSVAIANVGDDAIQVSFKDTADREAEDTGAATIAGGKIEINIADGQASKGIKADGDINISGGDIAITTACNGKWDSTDSKTKGSACIATNANVTLGGGTLALTATGSGGKGISCDGIFTANGSTTTIATSGGLLVYSGGSLNHNYTSSAERISSNNKSSAKGIKADAGLVINDGNFRITTSTNNAEGIESKTTIEITGGNTFVKAYDDGLNSAKNLTVSGGKLTALSTVGDAIDSNASLYISGGEVIALGAGGAEQGLDAADESGGAVYISGGKVLSCGGRGAPVSTAANSQPTVSANSSVSANTTVSILSGSDTLAEFEIPAEYSASSGSMRFAPPPPPPPGDGDPRFAPRFAPGNRPGGGGWGPGGSSSGTLLLSCPELVKGQQYNIKNGSSTTSATAS